jgi:hypothetical protein
MLSYLLFVGMVVVSGSSNSGLEKKDLNARMHDGGEATGGLVVKMGPVMNVRVSDVRVTGPAAMDLPAIVHKGSLFEGFSHSRVYAIRYGK